MAFTFSELVGALLAANLITVAFVGALWKSQKDPMFSHSFTVWVGLIGPLLFVASCLITAGP